MNQGCPGLGLGRATSWACAVATSPCHISPCHTLAHLILSPCHFMSPCHVLSLSHLMSPCHSSFCHPHLVTLSSHPVTLTYVTPSHLILSPCHMSPVTSCHLVTSHVPVTLTSRHLVTSCHPVTCYPITSHPVTLISSPCHLILSPCHISCHPVISCHLVTSCHPVTSSRCHISSCYIITSRHVTLPHLMSDLILSHLMSPITSHYVTPSHLLCLQVTARGRCAPYR